MGTVYVGTSGWSYPHWGKGRFYPKGLKSGEWLGYLARHFPTVEVNSTFYRLPPPGRLAKWRRSVGGKFRFTLKVWRNITHLKRLKNCRPELERFLEAAEEIGPKRGALLVQLPPSLGFDTGALEAFLNDFGEVPGRRRWRLSVEFRNPTWLRPETSRLLDSRGAALCLADMPRCTIDQPNEADFVYVRRHGPGERYHGRYSEEQIHQDAERIRLWKREGRDVLVYFNNDIGGHAIDNAQQLLQELGPTGVAQPGRAATRRTVARTRRGGTCRS